MGKRFEILQMRWTLKQF